MKRREFVRHTAAAGTVLAVVPGWTSGCRSRARPAGASRLDFDPGWQFILGDAEGAELSAFADAHWSPANLPHTARIENVVTGPPGTPDYQWQGTCWYRKHFDLGPEPTGRKVFLHFDGAMNVADVWLNGEPPGPVTWGAGCRSVSTSPDRSWPAGDNVRRGPPRQPRQPGHGPEAARAARLQPVPRAVPERAPGREGPAAHHRPHPGGHAGERRGVRDVPRSCRARRRRCVHAGARAERRRGGPRVPGSHCDCSTAREARGRRQALGARDPAGPDADRAMVTLDVQVLAPRLWSPRTPRPVHPARRGRRGRGGRSTRR